MGPGQLDQETRRVGMAHPDVDPALIFGSPPDEMWETAIRRLGADPSALQIELPECT